MTAGKQKSSIAKVTTASIIGNVIEYYDFIIYGTMTALVFNKLFFPGFDPFIATILAFSTFAVGFIARPVGAIIFGHFGDKVGRKNALVTTLVMMGLSTFCIGLLPTYESAGILSPILLVFLRFTQGISAGGEWGGAVLMAVEHASEKRRGLIGSLVQMGSPIGIIFSSGTIAILLAVFSDEQFLAWGWRIPFLISIVMMGLGLFIRLKIMESPVFTKLKKEKTEVKVPVLEVFKKHPRSLLISTGLHLADASFGFLMGVFVITYAIANLGYSNTFVINMGLISNLFYLVATPLSGFLSDKFGRRPIYLLGTILLIVYAFPFFWLLNSGNTSLFLLALIGAQTILGLIFGVQASFYSELFSAEVRYTGMSLGFQLATVLGGGLMPTISAIIVNSTNGATWGISSYLIFLGVITLISAYAAKKTYWDKEPSKVSGQARVS
ncbi:MFS transporter [Bacillus sp. B-jedd]|uniref:MFS transporter n=1 Tax=Bacillus sp. B-jedd TaxID=1476857 RepID=UPI0005155F9C|nr:MFS transporter [Bacillus sp. B-jedd]CEG29407.1 major facilitator superfamily protein [Bacillus sp. B-jedd]